MAQWSAYPSPEAAAWYSQRAAELGPGPHYGGGPGDIGWGPGVAPPSWAFDHGTALQLASIAAVANNPNLLHGLQSSPIPLWQINGEYPGGSGWVPGVTPTPPGWVSQPGVPVAPVFGGGPQAQGGARFVGPPVGSGGPAFKGPPKHAPFARALGQWLGRD